MLKSYLDEGFEFSTQRKAFFAKLRRQVNKGSSPGSLLSIRPHDNQLRHNQPHGGWGNLHVSNPAKLKRMIDKVDPRKVKRLSTKSAGFKIMQNNH